MSNVRDAAHNNTAAAPGRCTMALKDRGALGFENQFAEQHQLFGARAEQSSSRTCPFEPFEECSQVMLALDATLLTVRLVARAHAYIRAPGSVKKVLVHVRTTREEGTRDFWGQRGNHGGGR